jgi:hypothetical protein
VRKEFSHKIRKKPGSQKLIAISWQVAAILYLRQNTITMADQQPNNQQLNIEISEEVSEGVYSNLVIITHSHAEFIVDFVNVMPGTPKSKVKSRIILTPQHAKRFLKALDDNIQRFEEAHGTIKDQEMVEFPLNFGGPTAQA